MLVEKFEILISEIEDVKNSYLNIKEEFEKTYHFGEAGIWDSKADSVRFVLEKLYKFREELSEK